MIKVELDKKSDKVETMIVGETGDLCYELEAIIVGFARCPETQKGLLDVLHNVSLMLEEEMGNERK